MVLRGQDVGVLAGGSGHAVVAGALVGDGLQAAGGVQRACGDKAALQLALLHDDVTGASWVELLEWFVSW